ncbi:MAG: glycosyl hydrolase family 18 protein [Eubacteriales bacterium]|nr:glycosyl hydrolase family 18 protein [Eubacteriales bacterium]
MKVIYKRILITVICIMMLSTFLSFEADGQQKSETKFNMSYVYFGNSSSYNDYVDNTKNSLDEISPNYFIIDQSGNLSLTSALNKKFIEDMHKRGVRVVPFISNHWDRTLGQTALSNRKKLASDLAEVINTYDLDGINVDIENVTEKEREQYTDFVRLLREALPEDKTIAVAVAANPFAFTTGWKGSYDYTELAKYSDYLMFMSYDEHYQNSKPGAIASLSFSEKTLENALNKVPKDKIVLGIPFYGRIWKNNSGDFQGKGVSIKQIEELIKTYKGEVTFDDKSKSPYAVITIREKDPKPKIYSDILTAGTYTIWFESEESIKHKLELVQKFDIRGTGSWSLGDEGKNTWNYYKLWLNACYFNDVEGHWATDYILSAFKNDLILGMTENTFKPDESITRAQAAVIMVRLLNYDAYEERNKSFDDTLGHWAQAEIDTARRNGIINGVGDNLFEPEASVTREQMAVIFDNLLRERIKSEAEVNSNNVFPDVTIENNPWSYESIALMKKHGIVSGFEDGSFRPTRTLTRAEMTVLLDNVYGFIGR